MTEWHRADLPDVEVIADRMANTAHMTWEVRAGCVLEEVLGHLNAHYPKPEPDHKVPWKTAALNWEIRADRAERERDAAAERAEAHAKGATRANIDRDKAYEELTAMTNRAEKAERELAEEKRQHSDTIQVTDEQYVVLMRERDDAVRERCYWKARAEEAEADLEELSEEFADFRVEVVAEAVKYRESHAPTTEDVKQRWLEAHRVPASLGSEQICHLRQQRLAEFDVWLAKVKADARDAARHTHGGHAVTGSEMDGYAECCGKCGPGLCYVDQMTGEADEGWGWQR